MKKLGLALSALSLLGLALAGWLITPNHPALAENIVGPPNNIFCNKNGNTAILSTGTTQVIAGIANQVINICGYVIAGAGTGTMQIEFGTGASCTSPTILTAVVSTITATNLQDHFGNAWASSKPGESLCAVATGAGTVASVAVYVSQF